MKAQSRRWLLAASLLGVSHQISHADNLQLPTTGFISGRAATEKDVEEGNAVFVAKADGAIVGKPLEITIPQYAFWSASSGKTLVVIVQAEEVNGMHLFGLRSSSGDEAVATAPEIELLGTTPAKNSN